MKILSVNKTLPVTGTGGKVFFCNNSLLHYRDDLFLMTFRRMEFHIPTKSFLPIIHPWKMWDNGFKFLHPNPDRVDPTKKYGRAKYRTVLSPDRFVSFASDETHLQSGYQEFDSTGLVVLRYHGIDAPEPFRIVHSIDNLFGTDMNQDCRLSRDRDGELWLAYNGYFPPNVCKMLRRRVHLDFDQKFMYLHAEEDMIPVPFRQPIEKNCIMDSDTIYYTFNNGIFTVIRDDMKHECPVPFLQQMVKKYDNRFVISLGTPPLEVWPGRFVAVGHVKIEFRDRQCCFGLDDDFQEFVDGIDWSKIYQHGKYVYFMFLFEFNSHYQITRISHCFIPTDNTASHLPYLLAFPSGFTADPERYHFWLSYGEGDVRCKVLTFSRDDLDNLLFYPETFVDGIKTHLLNTDEWNQRPKIYHVGYFFENNCGDDMFRVVFQTLKERYYPDHLALFRNEYKEFPDYRPERDQIVFGGGDIVNRYFLNDLFRSDGRRKDAVSIGIPYVDNDLLLQGFKNISLRSSTDFERLGKKYVWYPDLGFLMPRLFAPHPWPFPMKKTRPRLGVCLARTFFRIERPQEYIAFILSLAQALTVLLEHMDVFLIPFCTRSQKPYEDDNVIHQHLREFFRTDPRVVDTSSWVVRGDPLFHTYSVMSQMDVMLCSRFHSHVFSIALEIPFVSLSNNRKVVNLMTEFFLQDFRYKFNDVDGLPIHVNGVGLASSVMRQWEHRVQVKDRLSRLMKVVSRNMDQFVSMWKTYVAQKKMLSLPLEPIPEWHVIS